MLPEKTELRGRGLGVDADVVTRTYVRAEGRVLASVLASTCGGGLEALRA